VYVVAVFFLLPLGTVFGTRNLDIDYDPPVPQRLEDALPPSEAASNARGDTEPGQEGRVRVGKAEDNDRVRRISLEVERVPEMDARQQRTAPPNPE
jgi:hypothetical protein